MNSSASRIHLTGSSRDPQQDLPYLRKIIETLHSQGASVVLNWVETAHHKAEHEGLQALWDWNDIVDNNLDAITRADALIIEGTCHGFFQGFQAALALTRRLPVLYISRTSATNTPLAGIKNKLLTVKQYTDETELEAIVIKFMQDNTGSNKPLAIDDKTNLFLRGEALLTGKSESEVIAELVRDRLKK